MIQSLPRRRLAVTVAALALLAGCSGAPSTSTPTDTVRFAVAGSGAAATDDPHGLLPAESDLVRMALTYDVLTLPGPGGATAPRLATTWTPDASLTRWTVTLRSDATFSDGRRVRAADALFSLRRMGEKAAENFGRMSMFDLAASGAPDDITLTLVTKAPYAEVGKALEGATFVVPEGSTDFTRPVPGSGPFRPTGGDAQTTLFERNDSWWGPKPPSRVIEVRALADAQARAQAVLSGQADLASSVPGTVAKQAEGRSDVQVQRKPGATMYPVVMRTDTAPFDDGRVREAVKLATDRQQLLDTAFLGYGSVGNDLITPLDPSSPTGVAPRTRDVAKAKALMAQAGLAGGVDVTLNTSTAYPGMDTTATLLAQQLAEIGLRITVDVGPPDTYFSTVYGQKPFYVSFLGGIPFLDVVRVALTPGSPTNETAWNVPSWNAGLATALADPDAATRTTQLGALQTQLRDEGGYLVWGVGDRIDLAAPGVTGVPDGVGFAPSFVDQLRRG